VLAAAKLTYQSYQIITERSKFYFSKEKSELNPLIKLHINSKTTATLQTANGFYHNVQHSRSSGIRSHILTQRLMKLKV